MKRRPPRSTLDLSSAASDVYKRQRKLRVAQPALSRAVMEIEAELGASVFERTKHYVPVSYTHLRAHETVLDLVCRLLLEKK